MKLYGILPYVLLEDSVVVAGVRFHSHYKDREGGWSEEDRERFLELNRLFADELNRRCEVSTWFLIDLDEEQPDFELAYLRLISAMQFSILDGEGLRSQPSAEVADAWLFAEEAEVPDVDYHFWRSVGRFSGPLYVSGGHDTVYPRGPQIRFDFARGHNRICETATRLVTKDLGALGAGNDPRLDSLPFFLDACRCPETSDIRMRLVALVAAFEVLFEIKGTSRGKRGKLVSKVDRLLRPRFSSWAPTDARRMFKNLKKFIDNMYQTRCDILHEGETKAEKLIFTAWQSSEAFIGYLWKGRQLFVACVREFLDILDDVELASILGDLVSNEDRLNRIIYGLRSGDPGKREEGLGLCSELQKYPSPESNELILEAWSELVRYTEELGFESSPAIKESLQGGDPFALHRLFMRIVEEMRVNPPFATAAACERFSAEWALQRFADFALYAVLLPHKIARERRS